MHRLRRESDVANDSNLRLRERGDQSSAVAPAFNLHRFRARLLDEARRVDDGLLGGGVIGAEGHVGRQQCAAHPAAHGARVVQHLLHGDGQCALVAQHRHA